MCNTRAPNKRSYKGGLSPPPAAAAQPLLFRRPPACPPAGPMQALRLVFNPTKPKLTVVSTGGDAGFLLTFIKEVKELDAAEGAVGGRSAGDVLDLSQASGLNQ